MSGKGKIGLYALGALAIIGLFVLPFLLNPSAQFSGTDNRGSDMVKALSPGYAPWFTSLWRPPPETESMLFAVQAAIGAGIIGYFIGYVRGLSTKENAEKNDDR